MSIFVKPTQLTFGSHVYVRGGRVTGTVKDTIIVATTLFRPRPVRLDRTQSPLQWCIPGTHTRETHQNNIKRRISRRVCTRVLG